MLDESWLVIGQVRCHVCRRDVVAVKVVVVGGNISLGFGLVPWIPSSQLIQQSKCKNEQGKVREEGNWVESLLGGRTGFLGGSTNRAELGRDVALERGSRSKRKPAQEATRKRIKSRGAGVIR